MPKAHLLHGYIASGKTTYAKKLEKETGAIRFSVDEWMINFYGQNPEQDNFEEYEDNIKRQIWQLATELTKKNIDIILDFGFWTKAERKQAAEQLENSGVDTIFYSLQCGDNDMLSRAINRTESQDKNNLTIDENAFNILKQYFEPITADEGLKIIEVTTNDHE